MFKIGEKVVCVETSTNGIINVIEGEVYTIERYSAGGFGVIVKEAISEYIDNGFWIHRFRKIDKSWTEEVLSKLIEEINADELIDA